MRVLIIDDDENNRKTTTVALNALGHDAQSVESGSKALKQLDKSRFDVAFLDLPSDAQSGLELLPELLTNGAHMDIVVCAAPPSMETAAEAMRRGAADYVAKPFTAEQIQQVLARLAKARRLQDRVAELELRLSSDAPPADFDTVEPALEQVYQSAFKAAATSAPILLLGESGSGKRVLARAIHEHSPQKQQRFVTVTCPNLAGDLLEQELFGHGNGAAGDNQGKVALAEGGTLFLDEIGELPVGLQPKLLRLLQDKEYERVGEAQLRRANVRIITSTNRNLEQAVAEGRFDKTLRQRLGAVTLHLPPLRERTRDLMRVAANYLKFFNAQCGKRITGFTAEAELAMNRYPWPGNLRELRNVVERAVMLAGSDLIAPTDLPERVAPTHTGANNGIQVGARVTLDELETEHIRCVLAQARSMEEAARRLGINPATLYRKRKRHSL